MIKKERKYLPKFYVYFKNKIYDYLHKSLVMCTIYCIGHMAKIVGISLFSNGLLTRRHSGLTRSQDFFLTKLFLHPRRAGG